MKTSLLPALLRTGLLLAGVAPASAVLLYEPFNYTPVGANLTGLSPDGTNVWGQAGPTNEPDHITIGSGSLSIDGLAPSIGNSIAYGGAGFTGRIPIASIINTGTVYYSFALRVTDVGALLTTGGWIAGFNNSTNAVPPQTTHPSQIGTRLVAKAVTGGFQIGLDKSSGLIGSFLYDNTVFNVGDTIFVVGSYTFNSGSTSDDESRMWINPAPSTFGLPVAPSTTLISSTGTDLGGTTVGAQQLQSFLFRQNATLVPTGVIADELRIDTTWAGVTPVVPEPSTLTLLSFAAGSALLTRRRNGRR